MWRTKWAAFFCVHRSLITHTASAGSAGVCRCIFTSWRAGPSVCLVVARDIRPILGMAARSSASLCNSAARGLGSEAHRGLHLLRERQHGGLHISELAGLNIGGGFVDGLGEGAVSYTHLTLPTSDLV